MYKPVPNQIANRVKLEVGLLLLALIVGSIVLLVGISRQDTANQLRQEGVVTEGTIVNKIKWVTTSSNPGSGTTYKTHYSVTYSFEAENRQVTEEVESRRMYNRVEKGERVNIRYLPRNPSISEIEGGEELQGKASSTKFWGYIIIIGAIVPGLIRGPTWLGWRKFHLSPKGTTQASIVDRRVKKSTSDKGVVSYTYYITYRFTTPESGRPFKFEEKVNEYFLDVWGVGTVLEVEYALTDPRLARRRGGYSVVENRPSGSSNSAPDNALAFYDKGNVYYNSGNLKQAIEDYTKAIELDPDFVDAYYKRGNAYSDFGNLEQAVADLKRFLELTSPNLIRYVVSNREEARNKIEELKSKLGQ